MRELDPTDPRYIFQLNCLKQCRAMGRTAQLLPDWTEGFDIEATDDQGGGKILIQCKLFKPHTKIPGKQLKNFHFAVEQLPAPRVEFWTTGTLAREDWTTMLEYGVTVYYVNADGSPNAIVGAQQKPH